MPSETSRYIARERPTVSNPETSKIAPAWHVRVRFLRSELMPLRRSPVAGTLSSRMSGTSVDGEFTRVGLQVRDAHASPML